MFLKALAWFGLFLFTLFVIWSAWILNDIADPNSWSQGRLQGAGIFPFLISFSAFGLPFMLIGGLVAKPGYFWLAAISIGTLQLILVIIFIIVTSGSPWNETLPDNLKILAAGIPSLISIGEGILLMIRETKSKPDKASNILGTK